MLNKQITNQTNSINSIIPTSGSFPDSKFSQFTEQEQSDGLSFKSFFELLQRRAIVIVAVISAGMTGVTYLTMTQKSIYGGNFQILVEPVNNDDQAEKISLTDSPFSKPGLDYESQIQVLKSSELLEPIIKKSRESYPNITYNSLISSLNIRRIGTTKIIEISYQSSDRQEIQFVLNTFSEFYLKYSLNKRKTKLNQGVQFVNQQLPDIQNRVTQLQKELQIFRQKYNFISPESQSGIITGSLQSLTQQRLSVNQQLAAAKNNYLRLQAPEEQLAILNDAPLYQQLIVQQRQLDTQISGELARFQTDNPVIQTLQDKRNNLLPIINAEAKRILNTRIAQAAVIIRKIEVDNQQLTQAEQQLQSELKQLPILSRQYADIQRNLQLANESLTRFLAKREQLQIDVAQTEIPWELIQAPAQSRYPISPDTTRNLLLGFVASSLLGFGVAKIMEDIDNTYHSIENLQDKIGVPLLGSIPFNKNLIRSPSSNLRNIGKDQEPEVVVDPIMASDEYNTSPRRPSPSRSYYGQGSFWESLQVLYSNIQLLNSDRPIKSFIVSSAVPGDGKSTVAFSLAKTAAIMGKKVLLVDCDLRKPKVHKLSQLNNLWGLSSLISSDIDVEQVIQKIPGLNDLSVITAGPVPPDPARLLSSDKMSQIMDYFTENFDLVIYDTPPLTGLVDARLVAVHTDGVMLVVRIDKTDKSVAKQLVNTLKASPINLLGLVVNGDKFRGLGYNYNSKYSSYYYPERQSVS
ncbi:polysaccharide biosynthesis tyrosine autokinase [Dolichospermum lemmermannii CS-548]|uniref:GumC family protein n=1 Tax=Dolichospermum lemmermannii TaxID=54295 RepID=UPI0023308E83|nr:polysaccharide biosynthesis tyrosine autokinase [Dolichospermum lemmermannii]MDB9439721.1 polysaccharide biosynthesis tyrosine autokinase [Dolichospermum lemmermannii CS-548]